MKMAPTTMPPAARQHQGGTISRMAAGHLLDRSDGLVSAVRIQYHCANARADGLRHVMVDRLAGVRPGAHAQEDLREMLNGVGIFGMQTELDVSDLATKMLLPSSLIKLIFKNYPREFERRLGANSGKLRAFWGEFLANARTRE